MYINLIYSLETPLPKQPSVVRTLTSFDQFRQSLSLVSRYKRINFTSAAYLSSSILKFIGKEIISRGCSSKDQTEIHLGFKGSQKNVFIDRRIQISEHGLNLCYLGWSGKLSYTTALYSLLCIHHCISICQLTRLKSFLRTFGHLNNTLFDPIIENLPNFVNQFWKKEIKHQHNQSLSTLIKLTDFLFSSQNFSL